MKTYKFTAELSHFQEIEVEAENYDEAYDLALEQMNDIEVYDHNLGYTTSFMDSELVDLDIPEED